MLSVRFSRDDVSFFVSILFQFCFSVKSVSCSMDNFFHEKGEKKCTVVISSENLRINVNHELFNCLGESGMFSTTSVDLPCKTRETLL